MSGKTFPLILHKTYYQQGFFNVTRDYDRYVRSTEGAVDIVLGNQKRITAKINRSANPNGTARIMGGVELRDWFQENFQINDEVNVIFVSGDEITIEK